MNFLFSFQRYKYTEFLPRGFQSRLVADFCSVEKFGLCDAIINFLFGQSQNQTDTKYKGAHLCHVTSGASMKQVILYEQLVEFGYFGPYKTGWEIPPDFILSNIKAPIALFYSPGDTFTNPKDANHMIRQVDSIELIKVIDEPEFNHIDFMWGLDAPKLVYAKIINFFDLIGSRTTLICVNPNATSTQ